MKKTSAWKEIGGRLREERERLGRTQTEFAELGSASKRSQTDWEQGNLVPNGEYLATIAIHGVDVGYVLTGERNSSRLSDDECLFLAELRKLDERGQDCILGMLAAMSAHNDGKSADREFLREVRLLARFRQLTPELKAAVEKAIQASGGDGLPPAGTP
jgi:transcriptional regulator with XRE-family HTH domain